MKLGKLNPTLFDKLTQSDRASSIVELGRSELQDLATRAQEATRVNLERYGESAMRASVRRELNWLLNSVQMAASQDLSLTPHVKTSVLNYGLPDMSGKASTERSRKARAEEMAEAIRIFEPRLDPEKLVVTSTHSVGLDNAISYVINGDITSAVNAMPVRFLANIEVETGEAVVQE